MGLGRRAMVVRVGVRMKDGGSKGPSVSEKGREESIGSIGSGSGSGQPGALRSSTKPLQTGTTWSLRTTETAASPSRIEKQPAGNMEPLSGATVAFNGLLVNVLKGMIDSVYQV